MIETEISQDQVPALPENPVSNFQFSRKDVVLANGNNDDIATDFYNYLRVTGPSAAFAIRGFAGGIRGALLYIEIGIAQTLTISNLSLGSLPGNRILTGTGADISITTPCVLQFVYNDELGAWVFVGKQPASAGVPTGVILSFAGSSAPSGYLLCDGAAVSRTTYAELYATIGTVYGTGDGSTTFNMPDLRGRAPVGLGTHADNNALNDSDGLAVGNRTHKIAHDLASGIGGAILSLHSSTSNLYWNKGGWQQSAASSSGTPDTGIGTDTKSAPFLTVNYIIKT